MAAGAWKMFGNAGLKLLDGSVVWGTRARACAINTDRAAVEAAFDLLPDPLPLQQDRLTYVPSTGTATAYAVALTPTLTAYVDGLKIAVKVHASNTGAATMNVDGLGAVGFDAIKHLVLCHVERRPPKLNLDVYPYLPRARVGTTSASSYMCLIAGGSP